MTTNDRHESETTPSQPLLTPGAILKAARERKGLSQQDIANRLNLRLTLIRDIEEDRFDLKTASTFTKGYLKTYAHFVGVDEHAVLDAYDRLGIKEQQYSTTMYSFSGRTKREASETRVRVISWVLCIGLIVAGGVWWWMQPAEESVPTTINEAGQLVVKDGQKDDGKQAAPSPDAAPVESSGTDKTKADDQTAQAVAADENNEAANQDSSDDNQANDANATDPNAAAADANSGNDQDNQDTSVLSDSAAKAPAEAQTAVPTASAQDASGTVASAAAPAVTGTASAATDTSSTENSNAAMLVQFTGPCWLKITDANGKSLLEGTRKAGDKAELSGTEPFHLTIGAPRAVNITFHGQPVDMSSYIRRGVVARYQLPIKS